MGDLAPSEIGTYRSVKTGSNPSDIRGRERPDARCTAGEVSRLAGLLR
jgi:hypothetical protein